MFRPEDVQLVPAAAANFSGKVVSSFFLGDHTRLVIDAGDGQWITVRAQQRAPFVSGESVHCAIKSAAVLKVTKH
jgi:putative spermidine/putrescine transport system ATP-binding protein